MTTFKRLINLLNREADILAWDEWTNPAIADVDYFIGATATSASIVTHTSFLNTAALSPPRNVTFVASSHADFNAVAMVITGTDLYGRSLTETLTLTDAGNTTDNGVKAFRTVTSIVIPAQGGTGGSYTIGFGNRIGLSRKLKERAGVSSLLKEHAAGSVATNGTVQSATTSPPHGTYQPNTAPDGSRDYAVLYEIDYSA